MMPWLNGLLTVSSNGRYLQHEDGTPFFYLADTCWEMAHRLNREEIEEFISVRARQGFNVLQVVALAEFDGIRSPNFYGHLPLLTEDPSTPNVAGGYWEHLDFIFDTAARHGIYVALLPTWGDKVSAAWGDGPVVFNETNARAFGEWMGRRYGSRDNLIWVNGGDRDPIGYEAIWTALARGFKSTEAKRHLVTFHPQGEQGSGMVFHQADWLDFNMLQTGHGATGMDRMIRMMTVGYDRSPSKPILDGEPRYENHPIEFNARLGFFDAGDVRQAIYAGLFSGGCGFTYGCHAIWQFASDRHPPINNPISHWRYSMELAGANQVARIRGLMFEVGFPNVTPAENVLADNLRYPALQCVDGSVAVYVDNGGGVRTLDVWAAGTWFDTRKDASVVAESKDGRHWEAPKSGSRMNDWVLRLVR